MTKININTCIMFMSTSHIHLFFNVSRITMHLFKFHDSYYYVSGWGNRHFSLLNVTAAGACGYDFPCDGERLVRAYLRRRRGTI